YPSELGGMEWGGVAYDSARGIAIINSNKMANRVQLITRAQANALGWRPFDDRDDVPQVYHPVQQGTPYAALPEPFLSPLEIPCTPPPYGRLSAVDLKTGKLIWPRAFGTGQDSGPLGVRSGLPLPLGAPNFGGAVVTQSGLTFIGATQD